jgi:hypothetical protein
MGVRDWLGQQDLDAGRHQCRDPACGRRALIAQLAYLILGEQVLVYVGFNAG